jgi:tRNA pseudouridine55 synthase
MTKQPGTFNFEEGELLLIDKPVGWTSFDVVNFIRSLLKRYHKLNKLKVGHAGTLDPLADGLLLICTGKMTKSIQDYQDQDKVYTGSMRMGITTPSYDLETEPDATWPTDHLTHEMLEKARQQFVGKIHQKPPVFSAIKIGGKRAFEYARKERTVKMETRSIEIHEFTLTRIDLPEVDFLVSCTKGTYIRSLVHDFGIALNNGACLIGLRRTKIGAYHVNDALSVEQIKELIIQTGQTGSDFS